MSRLLRRSGQWLELAGPFSQSLTPDSAHELSDKFKAVAALKMGGVIRAGSLRKNPLHGRLKSGQAALSPEPSFVV